VYSIAVRRNYPKGRKYSFKEGMKIAIDAFWGLLVAVIIIVGVVAGVLPQQSLLRLPQSMHLLLHSLYISRFHSENSEAFSTVLSRRSQWS